MTEKLPWIICSCGNIIKLGSPGTRIKTDREVREHPACGREPNRIRVVDMLMLPEADVARVRPRAVT